MQLRPTMTGYAALLAIVMLVVSGWYFGQQFFIVGAIVIAVLWLHSLISILVLRPRLDLQQTVDPQLVAPSTQVTVTSTATNMASRSLGLLTMSEGSSARAGIRSSEQLTFIPRLGPLEAVTWRRAFSPSERGSYVENNARLMIDDPWGWFKLRGVVPSGAELAVHPVIWDLQSHFFSEAASLLMRRLRHERQLDADFDFSHLRDYQVGDDVRLIHWKTSARRGQPVVLMSEQSRNEEIGLLLNVNSDQLDHESYERALSATASITSLLLAMNHRVQITALTLEETLSLSIDDGSDFLGLLTILARQPKFVDIDHSSGRMQARRAQSVDQLLDTVDSQPLPPQFYISVEPSEFELDSSLWCTIATGSHLHNHTNEQPGVLTWSDTQRFDTLWSQYWGTATPKRAGGVHAS